MFHQYLPLCCLAFLNSTFLQLDCPSIEWQRLSLTEWQKAGYVTPCGLPFQECSCGCAGIFSAPVALSVYVEAFEKVCHWSQSSFYVCCVNLFRWHWLSPCCRGLSWHQNARMCCFHSVQFVKWTPVSWGSSKSLSGCWLSRVQPAVDSGHRTQNFALVLVEKSSSLRLYLCDDMNKEWPCWASSANASMGRIQSTSSDGVRGFSSGPLFSLWWQQLSSFKMGASNRALIAVSTSAVGLSIMVTKKTEQRRSCKHHWYHRFFWASDWDFPRNLLSKIDQISRMLWDIVPSWLLSCCELCMPLLLAWAEIGWWCLPVGGRHPQRWLEDSKTSCVRFPYHELLVERSINGWTQMHCSAPQA